MNNDHQFGVADLLVALESLLLPNLLLVSHAILLLDSSRLMPQTEGLPHRAGEFPTSGAGQRY